jgi:hypothetical protein
LHAPDLYNCVEGFFLSSLVVSISQKCAEAVMSFKINNLVIHIPREPQKGCPPKSCFNTDLTGFVNLDDALGTEDLPLGEIRAKINAQIITNPTKDDLKRLEEILQDALDAVQAEME